MTIRHHEIRLPDIYIYNTLAPHVRCKTYNPYNAQVTNQPLSLQPRQDSQVQLRCGCNPDRAACISIKAPLPQSTSAALENLYIYNSVHSQGNTNPSARSRTSIPLHMYTFALRTSAHTRIRTRVYVRRPLGPRKVESDKLAQTG